MACNSPWTDGERRRIFTNSQRVGSAFVVVQEIFLNWEHSTPALKLRNVRQLCVEMQLLYMADKIQCLLHWTEWKILVNNCPNGGRRAKYISIKEFLSLRGFWIQLTSAKERGLHKEGERWLHLWVSSYSRNVLPPGPPVRCLTRGYPSQPSVSSRCPQLWI